MIAIIADTHMPKGQRRLPERCVELLRGADAVIHAGDFFATQVLDELRAYCPLVHAVHGNVDEAHLRHTLPAELQLELGGRTLAVVHDAGPAVGRVQRRRRGA